MQSVLRSAAVDVTCGGHEVGLPKAQLFTIVAIDASNATIPHSMKTPPINRATPKGTAFARACCVGLLARPLTTMAPKRSETLRVTSVLRQ